jgi:hypothetical protein
MSRSCNAGSGGALTLAFFGLPFFHLVDALAGLLAELALRHQLFEPRWHVGQRAMAKVAPEHFGDVEPDVEADGVGKLDRSHGHAEGLRRVVDDLGLDTFGVHQKGLHDVGRQGPVDQKAGA